MKKSEEIEETCKKLKPVIGDKAQNLWYMYLAEDEKNRKDLTLDIEIIAEKLLKKEALEQQTILLEPPSLYDSLGFFTVGNVVYNNKTLHKLSLSPEDFIKQIGIFAVTGEGKTNLAFLLSLELLKMDIPYFAIDWKRSWRGLLSLRDKIPELQKVQIYTIGRDIVRFPWNPLRPPPGVHYKSWLGVVTEVIEKSHLGGAGVADFFLRIFEKKFKELGFDDGKEKDFYPNFFDGKAELDGMRVYARELLWKQSTSRIFRDFTFGPAAKSFNARNPIKLEELLDKPVILELDLEMPKSLRTFFTEIILRWIHLYRLGQGETDQLRNVLFLEEVHNLFPKNRIERETSNSLENVYREIRAFGQGLVSITQHPSMLPIYILGNSHTQIFLGLQHEDDIRAARKSLFLSREQEAYPNMLKTGEAIVKIKNRIEPCLVKTPLVPIKKGEITDDWLKVNTPGYLPTLHEGNTSFHPGYLPGHIKENPDKGKDPSNKANAPLHRLLADIFLYPLSSTTQRYKRLGFNPKYGNNFKSLLISQGCIQPQKIITNSGWLILFEITPKGKTVLRDIGHIIKEKSEGIIHKFWKNRLAEYYRDKNYEVLVEQEINGKPDLIVIGGNKRVAVEIETGKSDAVANVEKNLKAGFDEIVSVATDDKVQEKIRRELEAKGICDDRVRVTTVFGFG
ncbi:MAG: hypothetical protein V1491_00700 [archaeon]